MKRMRPRVHLRVDERVSAARAEARDVDVMIDESAGIDVVERAFDKVGSFLTQGGCEILRLSREGAADVMDETHSCRTFSARSCSACVPGAACSLRSPLPLATLLPRLRPV